MTVQIDFDHPGTSIDNGGESGFLMLHNPESGDDYASWPFHTHPNEHYMSDTNVWKWENPNEKLENITLSPSLVLEWGEPNTFHIYIKDGEVIHLNDCQCGCSE